jgi:hypothetical protein
VQGGHPTYFMQTALRALGLRRGVRPVRQQPSELERLSDQMVAAIQRLRDEPDLQRRRLLVRTKAVKIPLGPMLELLEQRMARAASEHDRFTLELYRDRLARDVVGEFLQLLDAELADDMSLVARSAHEDEGPAPEDEEKRHG